MPDPTLMPRVHRLDDDGGTLQLPPRVSVSGPVTWFDALQDVLTPGTGLRFHHVPERGMIRLVQQDTAPDGYELRIGDDVTVGAHDLGGIVGACATLRNLLATGERDQLPTCRITDSPRFAWRGVHLDVARHFMPLPWLFWFVDQAAHLKLNRLHLHLTDDQGWRFEVKAHPRLTEAGSWRPFTQNPAWPDGDGTPHGGYYTQEQLRALVAHAAARNITVVPEIDVPGHVRALLAAYPHLGTGKAEVATGFGVLPEVLELHDESVAVIEDIFTELLEVFDSEWIHIGGDECPRDQWRASERMHQVAAARGLEDGVEGLQRWLTGHLQSWLAERGRRAIGWDEILETGPQPQTIVMAWRDQSVGRTALEAGHDVILAPTQITYLDHYQSDQAGEPSGQIGVVTWQDVMAWDPFDGLDPATPHLLGIQAQLWSEYISDPRHLEYMAFPRLSILAEIAWNGPIEDPERFTALLRRHVAQLEAEGINVRPLEGPRPWQEAGTGPRARPLESMPEGGSPADA